MKLLIADDELLTREGLASSIDWESLGIHQIFQADDGIRALHIARAGYHFVRYPHAEDEWN
jgi:two-component system response regulator YesN